MLLLLTRTASGIIIIDNRDNGPWPGAYVSVSAVNFTGPTIDNVFGAGSIFTLNNFTIDSFFDVFFDVPLSGGQTNILRTDLALIADYAVGGQSGALNLSGASDVLMRGTTATGEFQTEIVDMTLTGTMPAPGAQVGVILRQNPAKPSPGAVKTTEQGSGKYTVDSFFDVFFELSLDGGLNWAEGDQGANITLVERTAIPEPNLNLLIGTGLFWLATFGAVRGKQNPW